MFEAAYAVLARTTAYTAWSYFRQLQANQWRTPEELATIQWAKMKRLLEYAATSVPFYRDLWATHGIDPRRFSSIADVAELPVVTRKMLLEGQAADAFRLSTRRDYEMTHSSGTTGARVYLPFTRADMQLKYAAYLREFYATDWRLGVRSAALHHAGHPEFGGRYIGEPDRDNFVAVRSFVFRVLHNRVLLPPYAGRESGDEAVVAGWYEALRSRPPYLLESMDFNILALLQHIEEKGLPPLRIPRMIVLATLPHELRTRLNQAFETETFNRFGPHEMEGIAFECHTHAGLHICIDCVHAEFLDADDRTVPIGATGRLVLTDLDSYTMPLIRYELGDLASQHPEPCTCGRGLPLMRGIACRVRDLLRSSDGQPVVPRPLVDALLAEPAVRLFQVRQLSNGAVEARIVPDRARWTEAVREDIRARLQALWPAAAAPPAVVVVDRLPLERTGKFSFVDRLSQE